MQRARDDSTTAQPGGVRGAGEEVREAGEPRKGRHTVPVAGDRFPVDQERARGSNLYEHLAGVNDLLLARATFAAAVKRWPGANCAMGQGSLRRPGRQTIEQ